VVFIDAGDVETSRSWLVEEWNALIGWCGRWRKKNCRDGK